MSLLVRSAGGRQAGPGMLSFPTLGHLDRANGGSDFEPGGDVVASRWERKEQMGGWEAKTVTATHPLSPPTP
jgi:hypothetical protein